MRYTFLAKKMLEYFCILLLVVSINFLLIHLMPGEPLLHILGEEDYYYLLYEQPERLAAIEAAYGLKASLWSQYIQYVKSISSLDFGTSFVQQGTVLEIILRHLRWTLTLVLPAIVIAAVLGILLGGYAGWMRGGRIDTIFSFLSTALYTVPENSVAILLLVVFSYQLGWFPVGGIRSGLETGWGAGMDTVWHMILPLSVLVLYKTVYNFFIMKSSVVEIRGEEYITTAYAKGLSAVAVFWRHGLKNALLPYLTVLCLQFGHAVAGTMLLEVVFSWQGMGILIYQSVLAKDIPVLQGCFVLLSIGVLGFNFLADLLYVIWDPRIGTYEEQND